MVVLIFLEFISNLDTLIFVIKSFGNETARDIFNGDSTKEARKLPRNLWSIAVRKLDQLNAAFQLSDLKIPPGNRLEILKGDLAGLHSIRINNQYRIVFKWTEDGPERVKIIDYH
jgi:proteic killer suppression protein